MYVLVLTNQFAYAASVRASVHTGCAANLPLMPSSPALQSATRAPLFDMQPSPDYAATVLCGQPIASLRDALAWTQLLAGTPALADFPNAMVGGTRLVGQTLVTALPGLESRTGAAAFGIPGFAATVCAPMYSS